jgi:hypothetical protein
MKSMKRQFIEAVNMPDAPLPLRAARLFWENLTVFLCADLMLAWLAFRLCWPGWLAGNSWLPGSQLLRWDRPGPRPARLPIA